MFRTFLEGCWVERCARAGRLRTDMRLTVPRGEYRIPHVLSDENGVLGYAYQRVKVLFGTFTERTYAVGNRDMPLQFVVQSAVL